MLNIKALSDTGSAKGGAPGNVISYLQHSQQGHVGRDGAYYSTGYYSTGAPSTWHGTLAADIGLSGAVKTGDLEAMLSGETPQGETFGTRRSGNRRMGNDLTISAPKSISIQALALNDETVIAAHDRAVRKAIEYIESNIVSARYGRNGVHREKTGSIAAAVYRHEDARPVDGVVDPSLHSHVIAVNVTRDSRGNLRSTDLDFGSRNIRMETADAIYKAYLARDLENAGYQTRRTQHGFELANISDEQIEAFSRRTAQIEASEEYLGASTAGQRKAATLHTRSGKGNDSRDELRGKWRDAAEIVGVDTTPHEIPTSNLQDSISTDSEPEDQAINAALAHLDERNAVNSAEQLHYHALRYGMGQINPDRIRERLDERDDLHHTAAGIVSDSTLVLEDAVMHAIEKGRGTQQPMVSGPDADRHITETETRTGITYSDDQRRAAVHALRSSDQTTGIVGAAGSGKTTVIRTIADSARTQGFEIVGLAPSAVAAEELTSAGADSTGTLASHNLKGCPEADSGRRLYILDEAAMVSTRDMKTFMDTVRPQDRVLLSGDPRQLQAVESGAPYAQAITEGAVNVARMTEIRRQTDPRLREIAEGFAQGRSKFATDQAINNYTKTVEIRQGSGARGKPVAADKRTAIADRAARAFLEQSPDDRADCLVLAGNNDVRRSINEKVREGLVAERRIDADLETTVRTIEKTNLTAAQRRDVTQYQPGLVVRDKNGDHDVVGHDAVANTVSLRNCESGEDRDVSVDSLSERGTRICEASERQVAPGDVLIITENNRNNGTRNGDQLSVKSVNPEHGTINATRQSDDKAVELDVSRAQALDHGYAMTVHKAQGVTAERTIVAGAASRVATAEQAYVACSRERSSLQIITDNPEQLRKTWQTFNAKQTARAAMSEIAEQINDTDTDTTDRAKLRAVAVERAQSASQANGTESDQAPVAQANDSEPQAIGSDDAEKAEQPSNVIEDTAHSEEAVDDEGSPEADTELQAPDYIGIHEEVSQYADANSPVDDELDDDPMRDPVEPVDQPMESGAESEQWVFVDPDFNRVADEGSDLVNQGGDTREEPQVTTDRDPNNDDIDPMDESSNPESSRYQPRRDNDMGM